MYKHDLLWDMSALNTFINIQTRLIWSEARHPTGSGEENSNNSHFTGSYAGHCMSRKYITEIKAEVTTKTDK